MLRPENLSIVYKKFPANAVDDGSLKGIDLLHPNREAVTYFMLIEAERFWAAASMQLLAIRQLERAWLHSWSDVTFYFAEFFIMNSILRLSGRSVTFSDFHSEVFRIQRTHNQKPEYDISRGKTDHKAQWNLYYDLIQNDITDEPVLREIFNVQLEFRHQESWIRQMVNYDLQFGFDERHNSDESHRERAQVMVSLFPYENTTAALGDDTLVEIAKVIYIWKHLKTLFILIAQRTDFRYYWQLQIEKLNDFIQEAPIDHEVKEWFANELEMST